MILRFLVPVMTLLFLTLACSFGRPASTPSFSPESLDALSTSVAEAASVSQDQATPVALVVPTATFRPTPVPSPTPTSEPVGFSTQRTRVAPTIHAAVPVVDRDDQYLQWTLWSSAYPPDLALQSGIVGTRSIAVKNRREMIHQYTCIVYADGREVPRTNVFYKKDLNYSLTTNAAGEFQGEIKATTTVDKASVPVQWLTWASDISKMRLRGDDASRLVKEIRDRGATELKLELADNIELSSTFNVADIAEAMRQMGMACFK